MPIKGNRKTLPQKSYLFVDSDFDNNLSVRTPHPFQGSFATNKSPTLSRREGTESSSKKFEMYETKFNRSKERSPETKAKSKDRSRDNEHRNLSFNQNLTDEGSNAGYFTADRHSNKLQNA